MLCSLFQVQLCFDRPVDDALERYEVLERLQSACVRHGVAFLAFQFLSDQLVVVVEGHQVGVEQGLVGLRRGVAHSAGRRGRPLRIQVGDAVPVYDLHAAVVELHRPYDDRDPLASAWTSHRDLMALRRAPFVDGLALAARIDARQVHLDAGGGALPAGWPPEDEARIPLDLLLRVASAVLGVLPADRRSFAIFAHLARRAGYRVVTIAEALTLSPRRIRQFLAQDPELLAAAITSLADPRLRRVP